MKTVTALCKIGLLLGLAACVFRVIPPCLNHLLFQDAVVETAREAAYAPRDLSEDEIRSKVGGAISEYGIPLAPEDVDIERDGRAVAIRADYTVRVDLPLRPLDLRFHVTSSNSGRF